MALCFLQKIGLADDVLVDEQDIPAPVPLLPGSYRTHLLADFCHQTSAHHVWSRRSISLKQFSLDNQHILVLESSACGKVILSGQVLALFISSDSHLLRLKIHAVFTDEGN
ncbi:hypothetical protein WN944_009591 [Citrus x changshan-huyou]|uniref:Uncharacterized protein n=1 Tax=Citrus x changshan-huyou TaxID=2935761 RepID=A0AAP0MSG3_9ROSI